MGTNYYAIKRRPSLSNEPIHIGKASYGWKFLFQGYQKEDLKINSIEDWKKFLNNDNYVILDEYDAEIDYEDFIEYIEKLQLVDNPDNFNNCANINEYRFYFGDFS